MIVIVDYGIGNRVSVLRMLQRVGANARISADAAEIASADRLILPGVGAFDAAAECLATRGLIGPIVHAATVRQAPLLGICLGMQLMCEGSDEGNRRGLGFVPGRSVRFDPGAGSRKIHVPHMGWAELDMVRPGRLFAGADRHRFYFMHSYYVICGAPDMVSAEAVHGARFAAAFEHRNFLGVQFHPEKSHRHGMRLLKAFAEMPATCAPA